MSNKEAAVILMATANRLTNASNELLEALTMAIGALMNKEED